MSEGVVGMCSLFAAVQLAASGSAGDCAYAPSLEGLGTIAAALLHASFEPNKGADLVSQAD